MVQRGGSSTHKCSGLAKATNEAFMPPTGPNATCVDRGNLHDSARELRWPATADDCSLTFSMMSGLRVAPIATLAVMLLVSVLLRSPHLRAIPDTARQSRGWAEYDYYVNAPGSIAGRDVRSAWPTELAVEILTAAEVRVGSERLGVKLNSCRYTTAEGF